MDDHRPVSHYEEDEWAIDELRLTIWDWQETIKHAPNF
jgi:hypothetical protein